MQAYNTISTIHVVKELPDLREQQGRGKYVTSIEEAVRVCCDLRRSGVLQPITVYLEKGEYELTRTLELTNAISNVAFEALSGNAEDVIISGGKKIEGIEQGMLNGKECVKVFLPEVKEGTISFTDLYVNGERATLSRFPEEGYLKFAEAENMGIYLDDISKWVRLNPADVSELSAEEIKNAILTYLHYWIDEHTGVEDYDPDTGKLIMTEHSRFSIIGELTESVYYFENVGSMCKHPGEWYLDQAEGMLYYFLREGETLSNLEMRIPRLSQIANVKGTVDCPIKDITFKNITFAYTKGEHQSKHENGLRMASDAQAVSEAKGIVNLEYAQNCAIKGCQFRNYGLHGVNVEKGCSHIEIQRNTFFDGGAGGVIVNGADINGELQDRTHSNEISYCKISHCGRRHMAACGILIKHSHNNKIVHNEIHDLYYSGISVGWVWGYKDSVTCNNYIAYNHIYDLGKKILSDMGGVYLLGAQPGTIVENNLIHDIYAREYGGWALYTDEGSAFIRLENNICYRCSHNCYHQHYGRMNVVKNNIFAFAGGELCRVTWGEQHLSTIFENNILITDGCLAYGLQSREHIDNGTVAMGNNVIWSVTGEETDVVQYCGKKLKLSEAQDLGLEQGSIYANPGCKDVENDEFCLVKDSVAYAIGFRKIDTLKIGIKE